MSKAAKQSIFILIFLLIGSLVFSGVSLIQKNDLEKANTYKSIQKLNRIYQNPSSEDNWYYWSNMWLNEP